MFNFKSMMPASLGAIGKGANMAGQAMGAMGGMRKPMPAQAQGNAFGRMGNMAGSMMPNLFQTAPPQMPQMPDKQMPNFNQFGASFNPSFLPPAQQGGQGLSPMWQRFNQMGNTGFAGGMMNRGIQY